MNHTELSIIVASIFVASLSSSLLTPRIMNRNKPAGSCNTKTVLDSCALIDGRIIDIVEAGFVQGQLLVPKAVVRELQGMADQADPLRRERARYGLAIIEKLQQIDAVHVRVVEKDVRDVPVDDQLIAVAKKYGATIYTIDYNLNKVAQIEGVGILNVNELTQAVRTKYLPGELLTVIPMHAGQSSAQAVAYTQDGTMIVIENAKRMIGKQVTVECSKVIQTNAGKMLFAKIRTTS